MSETPSAWRGGSAEDRRIRALRPARPQVDTSQPFDLLYEDERLADGSTASTMTIFLVGRECPFTCVFCDLWRMTTVEPTPPGAISQQIAMALDATIPNVRPPTQIKLYNASNFFDEQAVPSADDPEIVVMLNRRRFKQVVVECHPRLFSPRTVRFGDALDGRLQIATGLETIHPDALPRLNKKASLADFDRLAAATRDWNMGLRAFVLIGAPFVPLAESLTWAVRSAIYAFDQGAEHVTLIPIRRSAGEMERLESEGAFRQPTLGEIEEVFDRCLELLTPGTINVDLWDLENFSRCSACFVARRERLEQMNLDAQRRPAVSCRECGG